MMQFYAYASYGKQIISSTWPSCWIQIRTVDAINVAADHQMFMTLTGELSWQRLRRSAIDLLKENKKSLVEPPFLDLGVTYALHLWLVGKPMVDFVFVIIELFLAISYGWDVISGNLSKSAFFEGGWVTLSADFSGKGASSTNHCRCQSSRVIALSCGIKIFTVHHLVLSQSTHATDIQTDGQTDRISTSKTALAYAGAVKTVYVSCKKTACNPPVMSLQII